MSNRSSSSSSSSLVLFSFFFLCCCFFFFFSAAESLSIPLSNARSIHTISLYGDSVVVVLDPLNDTTSTQLGWRQEFRLYSISDLSLQQTFAGFYDYSNITGSIEQVIEDYIYVYSINDMWRFDLINGSAQYLMSGVAGGYASGMQAVYDTPSDSFYLTGLNSMDNDVLRVSRQQPSSLSGAVRMPEPDFAQQVFVDTVANNLIIMGSITSFTSSASMFAVSLKDFRVTQNETMVGQQTDFEGITANIDVQNRAFYVVDATGTVYVVNLDNFNDQTVIYDQLGWDEEIFSVLVDDKLYYLYQNGSMNIVSTKGKLIDTEVFVDQDDVTITNFVYSAQQNSLIAAYFDSDNKPYLATQDLSSYQ